MRRPRVVKRADGTVLIERFRPSRRAEHWLVMLTFIVLVVTGFPQKFHEHGWARWVLSALGGLDTVRTVHRAAGLVFTFHLGMHLAIFVVGAVMKRMRWSLLPVPQDLRDAWQNLRFYLGQRERPPELPKFDYRQKFEYLGIVLGGLVMVGSGLILLYPVEAVSLLPGEVIPASLVAHSSEAMLALLVLVVWHIYGATLSPEVFPLEKTIFTGYISLKELEERHTREYRRLLPWLEQQGLVTSEHGEGGEAADHEDDDASEPESDEAAAGPESDEAEPTREPPGSNE